MSDRILCESLMNGNRIYVPQYREEGWIKGIWEDTECYQVKLLDGKEIELQPHDFYWIVR